MTESSGSSAESVKDGYTAVIYFHGMGSQRRYEELSRLVDAIDKFLTHSDRDGGKGGGKGLLRGIVPKLEPLIGSREKTIAYIEAEYDPKKDGEWGEKNPVRFYEVYWAPVMAGNRSVKRVLKWMFSQVLRPWQIFFSPWRERQRLRRAVLIDLLDVQEKWPDGVEEADFERLVKLYDDFEKPNIIERFPEGTFKDFISFIEDEKEGEKVRKVQSVALARMWLKQYQLRELLNGFYLLTLALALVFSALLSVFLIFLFLQFFAGLTLFSGDQHPLLHTFITKWNPSWKTAAGLAVSLFSFLGLKGFLTDYMGDVESWATYEETDKKHEQRHKVIELGTTVINHVLAQEACSRVVIVSHSLGTTVAHDTLLHVTRNNRARNSHDPITGPTELIKISHFVTLASPIDKIQYFFESYKSRYHRYKRVVEELRGDIGEVPFSRFGTPHIHWVNFWDEGDIISGALQSPTNRKRIRHRVDNVHVSSLYFPDPGESHSAYFRNKTVIQSLFEIIILGKYNYRTKNPDTGHREKCRTHALGPGEPTGKVRKYFFAALLLPWLAASGCFMFSMGFEKTALVLLSGAAIAFGFLGVNYLAGFLRGVKNPL